MGMVKQAMEYAENKLQQAIRNQHNFQSLELCFDYYRKCTFWDCFDDGFDEEFASGAELFFAEYFNQHFKTKFGE